jgi:soluble lytic murein transglycosylase-like protein
VTFKSPLIIGAAAITTILLLNPVWRIQKGRVLAENAETLPTVTGQADPLREASPAPTETIIPSSTKTVSTPHPSPLLTSGEGKKVFVNKYSSEEIYNMINQYSGEKGVSPDVIRHLAVCESGFRPDVKNGIYAGLFQYDPSTWKNFRKMMGEDPDPDLRFDAKEAIRTTVYLVSIGKQSLWPNCMP